MPRGQRVGRGRGRGRGRDQGDGGGQGNTAPPPAGAPAQPVKHRAISVVDKRRLIDSFNNGEDYLSLANQLNINVSTARNIVRRAQIGGEIAGARGGRRNVKVDDDMVNMLLELVDEHPEYTLQQFNAALRERMPDKAHISGSTVAKVLECRLITIKKLEDAPAERNRADVVQLRHNFAHWLMENAEREMIFIDESGVNLHVKRTRGRAVAGERAVRVIGHQRGRNVTLIVAASPARGLLHHVIIEGGVNAQHFTDFMRGLLALVGEQPVAYIMDNARLHVAAERDFQLPDGHVWKFQPPYSPFLNICDVGLFSCWKNALKQRLAEVREQMLNLRLQQRYDMLRQLAEQSLAVVTAHKCARWYAHLQTYLPRCIQNAPIYQ